MRFKSLEQRLIYLLLLPIALILIGLGVAGFFSARDSLLSQWRQSAIFSLARDAHALDMALERPADMVHHLSRLAGLGINDADKWREALLSIPAVKDAKLILDQPPAEAAPMAGPQGMMGGDRGMGSGQMGRFMGFHRATLVQVSDPSLGPNLAKQTVQMSFSLEDESGRRVGRLDLTLLFSQLVAHIQGRKWWRSGYAILVNDQGLILTRSMDAPRTRTRLQEVGQFLGKDIMAAMAKQKAGTVLSAGHPAQWVAGFHRLSKAPWTIVWISPGELVLQPIVSFLRSYLVVGIACVVLILILIRVVTGRLARSIGRVSDAARQVAKGEYVKAPPQPGRDEIARLVRDFNAMVDGLKERDFIRDTFSRYVDQDVAREIMSRPEASRLGGVKRAVAVMMTDIRGYTPLCEQLSPEATIEVINEYLGGLIEAIHRHGGIIVDFLGDAVLAFFDTAKEPLPRAAVRAVQCALVLRAASHEFNRARRDKGVPPLETGIGLHAGEVVVGNIGSKTRTKYGIVGGPVNLASRIQAQAEPGQIIVSQAFFQTLPAGSAKGKRFEARLKGVPGNSVLYVLEDFTPPEDGA